MEILFIVMLMLLTHIVRRWFKYAPEIEYEKFIDYRNN